MTAKMTSSGDGGGSGACDAPRRASVARPALRLVSDARRRRRARPPDYAEDRDPPEPPRTKLRAPRASVGRPRGRSCGSSGTADTRTLNSGGTSTPHSGASGRRDCLRERKAASVFEPPDPVEGQQSEGPGTAAARAGRRNQEGAITF